MAQANAGGTLTDRVRPRRDAVHDNSGRRLEPRTESKRRSGENPAPPGTMEASRQTIRSSDGPAIARRCSRSAIEERRHRTCTRKRARSGRPRTGRTAVTKSTCWCRPKLRLASGQLRPNLSGTVDDRVTLARSMEQPLLFWIASIAGVRHRVLYRRPFPPLEGERVRGRDANR